MRHICLIVSQSYRIVISLIKDEIYATYYLLRRDFSASLIPGTFCATSIVIFNDESYTESVLVIVVLKAICYFFCYIYVFCLSNQIVGIEEDRINKPDRPIVTGMFSLYGAWVRFAVSMLIFPMIAFLLGGLRLTYLAILWQIILVIYNFGGMHKHWLTKNLGFITAGTFALLAAAYEIARPGDLIPAVGLILLVSILFGVTLNLQDFRDEEGDREAKRITLPIALGSKQARIVVALSVLLMAPIIRAYRSYMELDDSVAALGIELTLMILNFVVAFRLLTKRTINNDHTTYMLHTYWFCAISLAIGLLMR